MSNASRKANSISRPRHVDDRATLRGGRGLGLLTAVAVCFLLAGKAASELVVGRASTQLEIVGEKGAGGKLKFRLIRVINQRGNNPFHRIDPINNRDGRLIRDEGSPLPQFANYEVPVPGVGMATLFINPTNDSFILTSGSTTAANAVMFQLTTAPPPANAMVFPSASGFQFVPAQPRLQYPNDGAERSFQVRHAGTGKTYRVTFRAGTTTGSGVTLVNLERV